MWIEFFVAVGLELARGGPEVRWLSRYWFLVFLGAMTLSRIWFLIVPRWSMKLARGDCDRRERILRRVVNAPAPRAPKVLARFLLGASTQVGGRYDEAEAGSTAPSSPHHR
jgi:hypothetical protein